MEVKAFSNTSELVSTKKWLKMKGLLKGTSADSSSPKVLVYIDRKFEVSEFVQAVLPRRPLLSMQTHLL